MRTAWLVAALSLAACRTSDLQVRLLLDGVDASEVVRLRTTVTPSARRFAADLPATPLRQGEQYEVACLDCPATGCAADCARSLLLEEDVSLGFHMANTIELRFRNEGAAVGALEARAVAYGTLAEPIASSERVEVDYRGAVTIDLFLRPPGRCGQITCAADEQCCGAACVSIADVGNCGACGHACGANETCSEATCHCAGAPGCTTGQACCPEVGCAALDQDPKHCGGCGTACGNGEQCVGGSCSCEGGPACAGDQRCCGNGGGCVAKNMGCPCGGTSCSDPSVCCKGNQCSALADDADCGGCGIACTLGNSCKGGSCMCGLTTCPSPNLCCTDQCVDPASDAKNCGGCGVACGVGEICSGGMCHCGAATDPACTAGSRCCAGKCVGDSTSSCGACDHACNPGEACSAGACTCAGGAACGLNKSCCDGACVDPSNSNLHCGRCDHPCDAISACQGGTCVQTTCQPSCVAQGNHCTGTSCSCNGGTACTGITRCCPAGAAEVCADVTSEANNCGSCGHQCHAGELCVSGVCKCAGTTVCTASQACCGGTCKDVLGDSLNCSDCNLACSKYETCQGGFCYCGVNKRTNPGLRYCGYGQFCKAGASLCYPYTDTTCPVGGIIFNCNGAGFPVCCGECTQQNQVHCAMTNAECPDPGQPDDCAAF